MNEKPGEHMEMQLQLLERAHGLNLTHVRQDVDRLLADAWDAALEEAKRAVDAAFEKDLDVSAQDVIESLKSQPRRYLDAEEVRKVLAGTRLTSPGFVNPRAFIDEISRRLGLDLDAATERGPETTR